MDKKKLKQHRASLKEKDKVKKDIDKLYKRLEAVPTVAGKVTKSSDEFPYIEEHIQVQMEEPKVATEIKEQIRIKERRLEKIETDITEVEKFIASIPDSIDRQIFELSFTGKKVSQRKIGGEVGYSQGRVSQIISHYLKD